MKICEIDGCAVKHYAKGFCRNHYGTNYRNSILPPCKFDGCQNNVEAKTHGLCSGHKWQWLRGQELRPINHQPVCEICRKPYEAKSTGMTRWCPDHRVLGRRLVRYGIDIDIITDMILEQDFKCIVCQDEIGLGTCAIDHDHTCCSGGGRKACGKCVRALLCIQCNAALGQMREDPNRIAGLYAYALAISPPSPTPELNMNSSA